MCCRSLSRAPDRALVASLSRVGSARSSASGSPSGHTSLVGHKAVAVEDRGMGRAVSRIMSRARRVSMSPTVDKQRSIFEDRCGSHLLSCCCVYNCVTFLAAMHAVN